MKELKLIYIEWADSISQPAWRNLEEALEWAEEHNHIVKQVGWIVKENDKYICIAGAIAEPSDDETQYSQLQKIPKTWIKKRRLLK